MESSGGISSTVADTTARSAQPDTNTGPSATLVSLADTQSVTRRPSVPMMTPLPPRRPSETLDTILVHPPSTGNTRVLVRKRGRAKMIIEGTRVSGSFGELIPNPKGPKLRRVREQLFGTVLQSIGTNKYTVRFDNGMERECTSNVIKIVPKSAGRSPDDQEMSESSTSGEASESSGNSDSARDESSSQELICDREDQVDTEEHMPTTDEGFDDTEMDDGVDDDGINIGDINVPADDIRTDPDAPLTYHQKLQAARDKVKDLVGTVVERTQKKVTMQWIVVTESVSALPPVVYQAREEHKQKIGLRNLDQLLNEHGYEERSDESCSLSNTSSNRGDTAPKSLKYSTIFAELFLRMSYISWESKCMKMNCMIREENMKNKREVKEFEEWDFIIGHALIIGAACYCQSGSVLFNDSKEEEDMWDTIMQRPNFSKHMKLYRFKEFRHFLPRIWEKAATNEEDPCWAFSSAVKEFNDIRNEEIVDSWEKVLDETMSAWRPRTSKNGGLPNINYIIRKPEPLGTEFKTVCCPVSGVMTRVEIQQGRFVICLCVFSYCYS